MARQSAKSSAVRDVNLLLLEEAGRQSRPAQNGGHGDLMLLEPPGEEAGNFEPIANDFGCSHGCKIPSIGNPSLAERAKLLAEPAKAFV